MAAYFLLLQRAAWLPSATFGGPLAPWQGALFWCLLHLFQGTGGFLPLLGTFGPSLFDGLT